MSPENQQKLADELEKEVAIPVPPPPPPEASRGSYEALLKHNNNPVYPEDNA